MLSTKSDHDANSIELVKIVSQLFWSIVFIFLICENCGQVTLKFEMINDTLCQCNWYLFSNEMQKMLVIVMINAQEPTMIHGFFETPCTRESFKKVNIFSSIVCQMAKIQCNCFIYCFSIYQTVNAGFSYFMMLRQIDG